jgi:hypothetical protein
MKSYRLIAVLLLLSAFACKKKENTVTVLPTSPYRFSYILNGEDFFLRADEFKYMAVQPNELGGYFLANTTSYAPTSTYPVLGLKYSWPVGHKVTEADVMALGMKNIPFSSTDVQPQIEYRTSTSSVQTWYSIDTGFYSVTLNSVKFLKRDTIAGAPLRCYVISGTCSTVLWYDKLFSTFNNGEFDMVVAMQE